MTIKANLGCGVHRAVGWVNVDAYSDKRRRPDVIADVTNGLPFHVASLDAIYAGHLVEHLPFDGMTAVLDRWWRHCRSGAGLLLVGPDCDVGREMRLSGQLSTAKLNTLLVRDSWNPGDAHLWESTERRVVELLTDTRWRDVRSVSIATVPKEWPVVSHVSWQYAVRAIA